jgi:hypothetical protein
MRCLEYAFMICPGTPVKIYGVDGQIVVDHEVPSINTREGVLLVRPGDVATIMLPYRLNYLVNASPEDRQMFDSQMTKH